MGTRNVVLASMYSVAISAPRSPDCVRVDVGRLLGWLGSVSDIVNRVLWIGALDVLPLLAAFVYFRWQFRHAHSEWSTEGVVGQPS